MSLNAIQRLTLKDHPNYDFNRYTYSEGDIVIDVETQATLLTIESAIDYAECVVIKSGIDMIKGKNISSIAAMGIRKMGRLYVHLTFGKVIANKTGSRDTKERAVNSI